MSRMAAHAEQRDRGGRMDAGPQTFRGGEGRNAAPRSYRGSHPNANGKPAPPSEHAAAADDPGEGGGANANGGVAVSFSTNHNSVVCLPLVSEGLKLVWTQSDQTRQLDCIPELAQAFNVFPYPSSREVASLARGCALPLDKVKVWFMVQRIKYGISWSSEEIEETRRKLAGGADRFGAGPIAEPDRRSEDEEPDPEEEEEDEEEEEVEEEVAVLPASSHPKRPRSEPVAPPARHHFRSSLPPPQDSYYYRPPAEAPGPLDSPPGPPPRRPGRYKKSKAQLAVLRSSFLRENWPAEAELRRLQEETGLSRNDIRKWFSDSRYQLRNGRGAVPSPSPGGSAPCPAPSPTTTTTTPPAGSAGRNGHAHAHAAAAHQLQPLPLIARQPQGGARGGGGPRAGRVVRSNGAGDASFFENFLSSSLEAVQQKHQASAVKVEEEDDDDEDNEEEALLGEIDMKEEEEDVSEEEQPLQLIGNRGDLEAQQHPAATASSPSPSPSPSLPHKRAPTGATRSTKSAPAARSISPFAAAATTTTAASTTTTTSSSSSSSSSSPSPVLTAAGRPRKTKAQLDLLKQHFLRCQWPKSEEYTRLVELTGLPRTDVIQWFGDTRYAVKNGQLRWVSGVRDRFMAELAAQQQGGGGGGGGAGGGASRGGGGASRGGGGGRKRKQQQENGAAAADVAAATAAADASPLQAYRQQTGALQEKDLDALCRKSRMSYQQVRDWFASQEGAASDGELNVTD